MAFAKASTAGREQSRAQIKRPRLVALGGFDLPFFLLVVALLTIGLVMLFSASYVYAMYNEKDGALHYIKRQLLFALIGIALMLIISKIDYHMLRVVAVPVILISIALLVIVLLMHPYLGKWHRWIYIGSFNFQPSEVAKFGLILFFAHLISINQKKMKTLRYGILPYFIIMGLVAALMLMEPHLSGTILILCIGVMMMIVGGASLKWFGIFAAAGIVLMGIFLFGFNGISYVGERLVAWTNKDYQPMDARWQINQSLYAIGSGGFLGTGVGGSNQKYLYVSEPQNDFIFSIVAEELGFVGSLLIIILFALLVWRGFVIAMRSPDKFGALLALGLTFQVGLQAALNIAVVTDTVPNTGISLPFFSAGGTSLVMLLLQMGIVMSVSRFSNMRKT